MDAEIHFLESRRRLAEERMHGLLKCRNNLRFYEDMLSRQRSAVASKHQMTDYWRGEKRNMHDDAVSEMLSCFGAHVLANENAQSQISGGIRKLEAEVCGLYERIARLRAQMAVLGG